jgi:hypothetical protein
MVGRTLEMLERPQNNYFWATRGTKKNIMCAENINVLVGENSISYSRIIERV